MATPVSYSFEPVIAASKQLLYGERPDGMVFSWNQIATSRERKRFLFRVL